MTLWDADLDKLNDFGGLFSTSDIELIVEPDKGHEHSVNTLPISIQEHHPMSREEEDDVCKEILYDLQYNADESMCVAKLLKERRKPSEEKAVHLEINLSGAQAAADLQISKPCSHQRRRNVALSNLKKIPTITEPGSIQPNCNGIPPSS